VKIAAACIGGFLLTQDLAFSVPLAAALLLYAWWEPLGDLALNVYEGYAGRRAVRELERDPHAHVDGFYVLRSQEGRAGQKAKGKRQIARGILSTARLLESNKEANHESNH
jgi:hypothetical protein